MNRWTSSLKKKNTVRRLRAAAILLPLLSPMGAGAFTAADADLMFDAHAKAFYAEENGKAWFKESTEGGKVSYWMRAEQMEMVLDAYERRKDPRRMEMFTRLFHGFLEDHGRTWEKNEFNDDIMWMVIACARGYLLAGDAAFLEAARANFDLCYARAYSQDLGGGLWWKTNNRSKNACVNGPGAIAAFLLHKATGEAKYLEIAKDLFQWERTNLFDPATGRVSDAIGLRGRVNPATHTYNQGTFVGAATLLGHYDDARLAVSFTMNQMCRDGYLPPAGEKGDGGGFNGIGARWIARYVRERGEEEAFGPWLRKNAEAAWTARRASDNLTWPRWPQPTPEGTRYSWGSSSAVVLLQVVPPDEEGGFVTAANGAATAPPDSAGKADGLIAHGAKLEILGEGYIFTEGPAADKEGNVYFTDQPNDRIVKYNAADKTLTDWLKPAGRGNGTYFDSAGNLLVCADEKNELWSVAPDKTVSVLLREQDGNPLNGPNDLWIRPDGNLFFTDPLYKRDYWKRDPAMKQPGQYVYFYDRKTGKAVPAATDLKQPNGIIGTPDGKTLYVADIGDGKTWSHTVTPEGKLENKTLFCEMGSDGMTLDAEGNVYLTGKGVTVFDKTGKKVLEIPVPEPWTGNVTFGGKDRRLLFLTASGKVYGLQMRVKGAY